MSLSIKESEKLRNFVSSVKKRVIREQNKEPHLAASARIVKSSNLSWSPIPGNTAGSDQNSESTSMKRRKRKNRRLEDAIQNHIDGLLAQQDLETPIKRKKLV